ncbi:MAG: Rid family hydrolase [Pseudomonadota bacterium]|nr:Rid family hydrolase [Pseudomonadota bacterium]
MARIQRGPGNVPTRRWGSAYKDLVWALGMSDDYSLSAERQVKRAYEILDKVLAELGTDKTQILSATVILNDINNKPMADKVWAEWMGDDPDHWPERSCHGVDLHAGNEIEIRVVAVRNDPGS